VKDIEALEIALLEVERQIASRIEGRQILKNYGGIDELAEYDQQTEEYRKAAKWLRAKLNPPDLGVSVADGVSTDDRFGE
jgi:hypothetical protein